MSPISSTKRTRRTLGFATSTVLAGGLIMAALALAAAPQPTVTGTAQVGHTLIATANIPEGAEATWQWIRCDTDPCAVRGTESTYAPTNEDVGHPLRARLTISDDPEPTDSAPTAPVAAAPPPPPTIQSVTITGTAHVGEILTASGATDGEGKTFEWRRCPPNSAPTSCTVSVGTGETYAVQTGDVGNQLRVLMTATRTGAASTSMFSDATIIVPNPPRIVSGPTISSAIEVGQTASATATSAHGTKLWQWLLCGGPEPGSCSEIAGATKNSYLVGEADAGSWLGVRLTVTGKGPAAIGFSSHTPIPEPVPEPGSPAPRPPGPFTSTGSTPDPPEVSAPTLLDPFPIVRIKGKTTRVGAQLSLFSVRAPRGTRIRVRCRSDYCPRSRLALNTRLHRLRVFERPLRAGVVIEVRVMHPKKIGKYTRFLIRRAAPPLRRDACLAPGSRKPTRCPGA